MAVTERKIKLLASFSLKIDEIADFFECDVSEIEPYREIIEKNWPNDKAFFKKRKSRLRRFLGVEEYIKVTKGAFKHIDLDKRIKAAFKAQVFHTWKIRPQNIWDEVGYSCSVFIEDFNKKFKDRMSWENWGEWEIDHIKPRCLFKNETIKECFKLSNLQPLWKYDNMIKKSKWQK